MQNKILKKVKKPCQYIGNELNITEKFDNTRTNMVLVFPDVYEIGVSNFGLKILYELINREPDLYADRAYAPQNDYIEELKKNDLELCSIVSKKPLKDFDVIGLSLQYELFYPTVLKILELANIGIFNDLREETDPIIIAGGPSCYNPNPMSRFIDLFLIGDGEELNIKILKEIKRLKTAGFKREEIIKELSKISGVYSEKYTDKNIGVKKAVVNLTKENQIYYPIVPNTQCVHDRAIVEVRRGCGRMCRFCQAGHTNLPIRERNLTDVYNSIATILNNTGYDEFSLLSLSSNDYSNIEILLDRFSCKYKRENISISLPSQRIDKFNIKIAKDINAVRKATITLAPEAGSQRLRNVINKNLSTETIVNNILEIYKAGFSTIKLYFMIGLPTETLEDILEMSYLIKTIVFKAKEIKSEKKLKDSLKINCSISIFVPKPFTPFEFASQDSLEEIDKKINYLRDLMKGIKNVKLKIHNKKVSQLEAVLSRGDKDLSELIYKIYKNNGYLISWEENFNYDLINSLSDNRLEELATKSYDIEEELPWDYISCGVDKSWFKEQYKLALAEQNIKPCENGCINCGVCKNLRVKKVLADKRDIEEFREKVIEEENDSKNADKIKEDKTFYTVRVKYKKIDNLKYISHLDLQNIIIKALYRTGLDIEFTKGFNPGPKLSLSSALPLFLESESEYFDFAIGSKIEGEEIKARLKNKFPNGFEITDVRVYEEKPTVIDKLAYYAVYEITFNILSKQELDKTLEEVKEKLEDKDFKIKKTNKKGIEKEIKISESIKEIKIEEDNKIILTLNIGQNELKITPIRVDVLLENIINRDSIEYNIKRIKFLDRNLEEL